MTNILDNYSSVYNRIIESISDDMFYNRYPTFNEEDISTYFATINSESELFELPSRSLFTWYAFRQIQNPLFKFILNNYTTIEASKILSFLHKDILVPDFDYQEQRFVLDQNLQPIFPGDFIVTGAFSYYKVIDITKNFKVKVENYPNLTLKYRYYYPINIRKITDVTNQQS